MEIILFQKGFTKVESLIANSNLEFYFACLFFHCMKVFWCSDLLESSFISFDMYLSLKEGINVLKCNKQNLCT